MAVERDLDTIATLPDDDLIKWGNEAVTEAEANPSDRELLTIISTVTTIVQTRLALQKPTGR